MGGSDIGCHVGDVQTAHLDRLFTNGVRFTHFHPEPVDRAAFFVPGRVTMSVHLAMGVVMAAFDLTVLPNS